MGDEQELDALQHRDVGEHTVAVAPHEIAAGWVIECVCGWDNEVSPAGDPDTAREHHRAHVELIRRRESQDPVPGEVGEFRRR